MTLRVTINRVLESGNTSSKHGVSAQDMASAHKEENWTLKTEEKRPLAVEQKVTAEEAVKMKKRKRPCDVAALTMPWGVVAESYIPTMNPAAYHQGHLKPSRFRPQNCSMLYT
ncbi:hypothetical protein P3S68_021224 [Capsicum galapagoense]